MRRRRTFSAFLGLLLAIQFAATQLVVGNTSAVHSRAALTKSWR